MRQLTKRHPQCKLTNRKIYRNTNVINITNNKTNTTNEYNKSEVCGINITTLLIHLEEVSSTTTPAVFHLLHLPTCGILMVQRGTSILIGCAVKHALNLQILLLFIIHISGAAVVGSLSHVFCQVPYSKVTGIILVETVQDNPHKAQGSRRNSF